MKKAQKILGFLMVLAVVVPGIAAAAIDHPGNGGSVSCTPSTQYELDGQFHAGACKYDQDVSKRLYDLEVDVIALRQENIALKAQLANNQAAGAVSPTGLEARVSQLESTVTFLQKSVMAVLGQVVALLTNIKR